MLESQLLSKTKAGPNSRSVKGFSCNILTWKKNRRNYFTFHQDVKISGETEMTASLPTSGSSKSATAWRVAASWRASLAQHAQYSCFIREQLRSVLTLTTPLEAASLGKEWHHRFGTKPSRETRVLGRIMEQSGCPRSSWQAAGAPGPPSGVWLARRSTQVPMRLLQPQPRAPALMKLPGPHSLSLFFSQVGAPHPTRMHLKEQDTSFVQGNKWWLMC